MKRWGLVSQFLFPSGMRLYTMELFMDVQLIPLFSPGIYYLSKTFQRDSFRKLFSFHADSICPFHPLLNRLDQGTVLVLPLPPCVFAVRAKPHDCPLRWMFPRAREAKIPPKQSRAKTAKVVVMLAINGPGWAGVIAAFPIESDITSITKPIEKVLPT